jgi:hypothetical protein
MPEKGGVMTIRGPEDRERFTQRSEPGAPRSGIRAELEPRRSAKVVAGGSVVEAVCGGTVVVLAIIALAGASPRYLASVATIVLGVALIAHGGAIGARFRDLTRETAAYEWDTRTELGGGMSAELVGGAAAIVLGILGLIGLDTPVLVSIAVIVLGGALLLGSAATIDLSTLGAPGAHEHAAYLARRASEAASGTQALAGLGAVVLGIIALVVASPTAVNLVALLVLGSAAVLSGAALSSRMVSVLRH